MTENSDSPLYNEVLEHSIAITNASEERNVKEIWTTYSALEDLCINNEASNRNHPLQWEALADFTTDDNASIPFYKKALDLAEEMNLTNYMASINLALAERYLSLSMNDNARTHSAIAKTNAEIVGDLELLKQINEFFLELTGESE